MIAELSPSIGMTIRHLRTLGQGLLGLPLLNRSVVVGVEDLDPNIRCHLLHRCNECRRVLLLPTRVYVLGKQQGNHVVGRRGSVHRDRKCRSTACQKGLPDIEQHNSLLVF